MNLITGDVIIRRSWTEIPVPSEVIFRVEELAKNASDAIETLLDEDDEDNEQEQIQVIDQEEDTQDNNICEQRDEETPEPV
jgi:hypothetical protein